LIHNKKDESIPEEPRLKVQIKNIKIPYPSDEISSEAELRSYIQAMNQSLLREIKKGNIVSLNEEETK
jgi:hypothetical protein